MANGIRVLLNGDLMKPVEAIALHHFIKEREMELILTATIPTLPPVFYQLPSITMKTDKELVKKAQNALAALGDILNVPKSKQIMRSKYDSLQALAKALHVQLIIHGGDETPLAKVRHFITYQPFANDKGKVPSIKVQAYLQKMRAWAKEKMKKATHGDFITTEVVQLAKEPAFIDRQKIVSCI